MLVENMGTYYLGNRYHILERNCNHFSKDLVRNLTGCKQAFPNWVSLIYVIMEHILY